MQIDKWRPGQFKLTARLQRDRSPLTIFQTNDMALFNNRTGFIANMDT